MPYYNFYDESGEFEGNDDEDGSGRPGVFNYEGATGQFKSEKLEGLAAAAYELLIAAGVAEMRVRYDGGNDEGFAHADHFWINGDGKSLDEIIDLLSTQANIDAIRAIAAEPRKSHWYNAGEIYRQAEPRKVIANALDEVAQEMASQLLGSGFGTGEYELYGAATVIFATGEMIDDPDAEKPLDRM